MYCCVDNKESVEVIDEQRSCVHYAILKVAKLLHVHVESDELMALVSSRCAMNGTSINEMVL